MGQEGFFTKKETELKSSPNGKQYSCVACGLHRTAKSPRMKPYGNFKKGILNIGEAPGEKEDATGKPWQGRTGQLLFHTYQKLGIDLFEDCLNINACHCRPLDEEGENRPPTNYEIESCRKTTLSYIEHYKPKVIVVLGNSALYSLLGHRWKKDFGTISKWRGWIIPDQDLGAWLCPTFHPSYVERAEGLEVMTVWMQDLKAALHINKEFPIETEPSIEYLDELSPLRDIKEGSEIAIDFETTGRKPHAIGQRIICVSIATSDNHAYAFMLPPSPNERKPFIKLLTNPKIGKIAQNMKFEHAWSLVRLKTEVQNWTWDTMLASHILDNRPSITGLKFQTYVQFGVVDYSSELDPYLKPLVDGGANTINRVYDLLERSGGKEKLMKYCALDSLYTYRLAKIQQSEIMLPF